MHTPGLTAASSPVVDTAPPPSLPDPIREVHVLDRLVAIFRHLKLVVAVFAVVVTIGALQSFSTVARYQARATVLVDDERSISVTNLNAANAGSYWADPEPYFNTQLQILRGRALGERVVDRLDLVNRGLPQARTGGILGALTTARVRLSSAVRGGAPAPAPEMPVDPAVPPQTRAVVGGFLSGITVIPVRGTRLVEVNYDSTDPQFAALAVNTLVEEYVEQNLDLRLRNTDATLEWLTQQLAKQQEKLQLAERQMADYRSGKDALSLDSRQNIILAQLTQFNDAVTRAKTARLEKQALYDQIKDVTTAGPHLDSIPAIGQNGTIQTLKGQLGALEAQQATLGLKYGVEHPEMKKLAEAIDGVNRQLGIERGRLLDGIRSDYRSAMSNESSLAAALEDQKGRARDLDQKNVDYTLLDRVAASEREVYQSLLQQEKELRVIRNSRANNIQVLDRADIPKAPYTPDHRRNMLMSVVLGLALAVGLAFGIEYLDDTIKTPDDVTKRLKLPLLGLVPAVRGDRAPVLSQDVPHDFGEAFRSLRTSLVFTSRGTGARMLGVTSTQPLEGKTTTACNLAMVLAYGGARVLLIDADMRRPGLHRTMGMQNQTGLSHVLTGQARIREVVRRTADPNLLVITAGRTPPNPSELLASDRMQKMMANLAHGPFDWVIVDTPPVLAVTDAVILAPQLSGFVFVVGAEMTRRAHVERAVETMQVSNNSIVGVVLNRVDFDRNKYYYSRYYGYQYKSYYGQSPAPA